MRAWRLVATVLLVLAAAPAGWGQTCNLAEAVRPNDCFRYHIALKLSGELRFRKDDGTAKVKLSATATHAYPERVLVAGGSVAQKAARVYEEARAVIDAGGDRSERGLRPTRKLIVAQRHKDQALAYCPGRALYRSEVELVSDHFDTLSVAGLLPGKAVKVGETWKVDNGVVGALCHLDGLTENKLEGKLEAVAGGTATFRVSGTAAGVENGALVKMTVDATGVYDTKTGRLTRIEWKQKDEREAGPVSPAATVEAQVSVRRQPIAQPKELDDVALVSVPQGFDVPAAMTYIEQRDARDRFALLHTRDWQLTAVTAEHTVLRLIDKGDFVAQVTVTPWTRAKKGEHLTPEQFKAAMHATPGWRPERELQAGEVPATDGKWIYRLGVQGELNGVAVLQYFYLIAAPGGEQVVLAFTLSPKQADKLGARDLALAGSIEVPAAPQKR